MTITEATENGTHRDLLVALRAHIAAVIDDGCSARDLVGLSRRLVDLCQEIQALDASETRKGLVVVDDTFDPEAI